MRKLINQILQGDVLDRLREIPGEFVNCIMFSPPYWRVRDYDIKGQIGQEPDYNQYLMIMWAVFDDLWRILRKDGTMWVNVADSYWTAKGCCYGPGAKGGPMAKRYSESGISKIYTGNQSDYPHLSPKTPLMLPELMIMGLVDPEVRAFVEWRATGRPGDKLEKMIAAAGRGKMLRNKCIWYKPNPGPESAMDRLSRVWEYLFFLVKSRRYYFDLDAVRQPHKEASLKKLDNMSGVMADTRYRGSPRFDERGSSKKTPLHPGGRNPGDFISIPTVSSGVKHYAAYPPKLCELPLKAGCPRWVCNKCGKPRTRITRQERINTRPGKNIGNDRLTRTEEDPKKHLHESGWAMRRQRVKYYTIGWTDCRCGAGFRPGIVLDPFCGTGTTLAKAKELGLDYIGIDIKKQFCQYATEKVSRIVRQEEFENVC